MNGNIPPTPFVLFTLEGRSVRLSDAVVKEAAEEQRQKRVPGVAPLQYGQHLASGDEVESGMC